MRSEKQKTDLYQVVVLCVDRHCHHRNRAGGGDDDKKSNTSATQETTSATQETQKEQAEITYTHYNVTDLFDALNENAMKAEKMFQDQYVEIEGKLGTIDSDGKYIAVEAVSGSTDYLFKDVQCFFQNDEQKDQVMEMSKGDPIVVRGKITSIGEVLGYELKIDSIN